ncbi:MAG TPA: hypothetical protein VG096_20835 [Bryobacteraceae bacterium]|jgi:hypothetical protein|nr:hypothetical protein [Bryobacteraceae bacterium]
MTAFLTRIKPPLTGISSLAIGADQIFAEVVLELQGSLEAVVPFENYERTFDNEVDLARFHLLRAAASKIEILTHAPNDEEAYLTAGKRTVALSETLIAVWDGLPALGVGGTAQIVEFAQQVGVPVIHLNPVNTTIRKLLPQTT